MIFSFANEFYRRAEMLAYSLAAEVFDLMRNKPSKETWHRFIAKIDGNAWKDCWKWTGSKTHENYGTFWLEKGTKTAHRLMALWTYGEPAKGLVVDHVVCNNESCVNPLHLRFCTVKENTLRSTSFSANYARSTHCQRGHERTPENQHPVYKKYYGEQTRVCKECTRQRQNEWARQWRANNNEKYLADAREGYKRKMAKPGAREANREYQRTRLDIPEKREANRAWQRQYKAQVRALRVGAK